MASWSTRRQLTYFFGFFAVVIAAAAFFASALWPRPSCGDGRRNQGELGIDCGGLCSAVCSNEAQVARALWVRVLPIGSPRFGEAGAYDLVGFVRNPNSNLVAINLPYELRFVDSSNTLINTLKGEVSLWPNEDYPIFIPNINVGKRVPTRAYLTFTGLPRWERSTSTRPILTVLGATFIGEPTPVIKARLVNNSPKPVAKVEILVLLSDNEHNVFASNSTFIEQLNPEESKEFSFTWPRPFSSPPTFTEFYTHVEIEPVH